MWTLSEEQLLLKESAERFVVAEYDFERRKRDIEQGRYSDALWQQFAELGWLGIAFDEQWGGFGGSTTDIAVLMQALGSGLVVSPYSANILLAGRLIADIGSDTQRDEFLPSLIAGERQLAFAYAEPQSRYDLFDVQTTTQPRELGFVINGQKSLVLNGDAASHIVVTARSHGGRRDQNGISLFVVDTSSPGVKKTAYRTNDDHYAADIALNDVALEGSALLGSPGDAFEWVERAIDEASVAHCAEAIGAMDRIMQITAEYMRTREQFGRPISKNQALQFRMVEMFYALEESRSMLQWALETLGGEPAQRRAAVSALKVKLGDTARHIGQQGVQLHGAIGLTAEYSVGHFYKRLESIRTLFGDPEHHVARYGRWSEAQNTRAAT
ncbi:MAG: acyl-CoA dehydrogenase [Pseudomonadota bacterium]